MYRVYHPEFKSGSQIGPNLPKTPFCHVSKNYDFLCDFSWNGQWPRVLVVLAARLGLDRPRVRHSVGIL